MPASSEPLLPPSGTSDWGTGRRLIVVVSAVLCCLFNAGLAFGFSALLPVLIDSGAFHDVCSSSSAGGATCPEQLAALTGMFTLATSLLNVFALPSGALLDCLGPKRTAGCLLLCSAAGCMLFAQGGDGSQGHIAFYGGFLLFAISGPSMFNCTLSFSNFFPKRKGLICACLVGCFDASSSIFVGLASFISGGATIRTVFQSYAACPAIFALLALSLWPAAPVSAPFEAVASTDAPIGSDLSRRGVRAQMLTLEFVLLTLTVCVTMICINFFIATSLSQMTEANPDAAIQLTKAFSIILPCGAIVYTPVIGSLVDRIGPTKGFVVLWFAYLAFQLLLAIHAATGYTDAAYAAFVIFAYCRPLFYTLGASFTGEVFGFGNFGTLYGTVNTIAGLTNTLMQPLSGIATTQGFGVANSIVSAAFVVTAALPAYCLCRGSATQGVRASLTARAHSVDLVHE
ncbi:hypothetical protein EMIHUDRAFT_235992 [Emiliania huxleyi CCMP1516]|uniref:Major facilitator superfamily (MFS) profile domain-containing protein n=2 Tax=Emiliania huxleyi TaxID=2903 RepID=A0A0D3JV38_EMIH1|nr:hypothetical protein EMIHUDRAFT_235992 [Emiliania huxleyi CCMP1516]EOD27373.1 hypothetical protein EMIHUDRAFT_235992 [Emiliania huxleyi CCMP1516]|eukprot:XP_005779802.1 hypothetical protein EMIHUDRAFT_235992 [Emiliania huxleyi CCMP1516]